MSDEPADREPEDPDVALPAEDDFLAADLEPRGDAPPSPERDPELEEELLPLHLEEASLIEREPVRIGAALGAGAALAAAALAAAERSPWAPALAALGAATVVIGELARARVTPMAAPQLETD